MCKAIALTVELHFESMSGDRSRGDIDKIWRSCISRNHAIGNQLKLVCYEQQKGWEASKRLDSNQRLSLTQR